MKIKSIHLKEFKRFTDLKITGLPDTAKLVVLLGPNGCGKSSVFDAIYAFASMNHYGLENQWRDYYGKESIQDAGNMQSGGGINERTKIEFHEEAPTDPEEWRRAVYPRTAYRHVSSFDQQQLSRILPVLEERRFSRFSQDDKAADNNYIRLISKGFQDAFEKENPKTTMEKFRRNVIGEIADNLKKMFPDLVLKSLGNPLESASTFRFDKGVSQGFSYENLSGGEKAAFDLILDLVIKRTAFNNTVYCIDEPEAHMSTRLQKDLLACLYELIPEYCQLWIATHSIGMIRKAREFQQENPSAVAFLDFDDRDFDKPETITPVVPTRAFWQKTYEIALDDLAKLVVPKRIILCEGEPGKDGFDARCYNQIFGKEFHDTLFVSAKGSGNVKNLRSVIQAIAENAEVIPLIDRDEMTNGERNQARQEGVLVLNRRALENYLIDDEVIHRWCEEYVGIEKASDLIQLRDGKIENGNICNGKVKEAAEAIRIAAKDNFGIPQPGGNWQEFVSEFMVPLITSDTAIYQELKNDIFGNDTMKIVEVTV
ncbi:AAA family ATPase [Candidatus Spongiihabitans sp.]|uniref:AAA family ATPase n=1 Tax=Candidatus Spongiihabitans sp. TaxID=3101308 RepID=UPI003C7EB0D1